MAKYPETGKQWYTLQVLSNQENQVLKRLERQIAAENAGDRVHQVLVPTEVVEEPRNGRRMKITKKLFPGYVFVNMDLYNEAGDMDNTLWYFVLGTDGVISFAGGNDAPLPMTEAEVERLHAQIQESQAGTRPRITFEVGETVRVKEGAFEGQEGEVQEVNAANGTLIVAVSFFGRSNPVELKFFQVEKPEE